MRRIILFGALSLALLLRFPTEVSAACSAALSVWAVSVVPSLFPFIAVCSFLSDSGALQALSSPVMRAFRLPADTFGAALIGCVSGYPAGAKLSGGFLLTNGERLRLLALCSTASPMFTIGTVAKGMLGSVRCGWIMYASTLVSAALTAFAMGRLEHSDYAESAASNNAAVRFADGLIMESIWDAVVTLLKIGGCITAFYALYALSRMLFAPFLPNELAPALFTSLFETTMGCHAIAALELSLPVRCALCTFSLCFGGGCVIAQVTGLCPVSPAKYAAVKLAQACVGYVLCLALTSCFAG